MQQLAGPNQVGTLSAGQIAEAFKIGGIGLSQQGAQEMQIKVDKLEFIIADGGEIFSNAASIQSFMNSGGGVSNKFGRSPGNI